MAIQGFVKITPYLYEAPRSLHLKETELKAVLEKGSEWALGHGYAMADDLAHTEDSGRLAGADISALSPRALERGRDQVGTLGSGNHFLEIDEVAEAVSYTHLRAHETRH